MKESCSDPVGILCEYNPFHRGHAHQLQEIRETTDAPIICVMSGRFVQRGEPALCDPLLRAEMAIEAGADLV